MVMTLEDVMLAMNGSDLLAIPTSYIAVIKSQNKHLNIEDGK
jgi:hypothetical protein